MVRYSFLVGLFHPRLHAGLSRRLRSLAVTAQKGVPLFTGTYRAIEDQMSLWGSTDSISEQLLSKE